MKAIGVAVLMVGVFGSVLTAEVWRRLRMRRRE